MAPRARSWPFIALLAFVSACSNPVSPVPEAPAASADGAVRNKDSVELADWIANPPVLPPGRMGRSNCTYRLTSNAHWDFYPEGGCWERQGPDGWVREQFNLLHSDDGNDVSMIRVCRQPGEITPCGQAGPFGCAVCTVSPVTH
jgi:hypothetical protein